MSVADTAAAEAFGPQPGERTPGQLSIGSASLLFVGGGRAIELPFDLLAARLGGFDDRQLLLSHPTHPGVEIGSADPALAAALAELPAVQAALARRRAGRMRYWGCLAIVAAVALAVLAALWLLGVGVLGLLGW